MDNSLVIELSSDDEAVVAAEKAAKDAARKAKAKRRARKAAARKTAAARQAAAAREANRIIMKRGPKTNGGACSFDKCCIFGNNVALKHKQVQFLKKIAAKRPSLPPYVCTMQLSNTMEPKAKMYFPKKFSNAYIKKYMELPCKLKVYCPGYVPILVNIIMGKGKGKGAQLTTNWCQVVELSEMHPNDVVVFRFRRSQSRDLS